MHHNLHFYKNLINLFSAPCGFCLLVYIFLCFDFTVSNFLKFSQEPVSFSPELWNTNNFELLQHPISEISPELFEAFWSHWFIPLSLNGTWHRRIIHRYYVIVFLCRMKIQTKVKHKGAWVTQNPGLIGQSYP